MASVYILPVLMDAEVSRKVVCGWEEKVGYFDGLADAIFKTDEQKRSLFYPWGVFGAGYVMPTELKKQEIRTFIKRTYMILLPGMFVVLITAGIPWVFATLPFYYIWYYLVIKRITKDLQKSNESLKVKEAYKNSAHSHNLVTLIGLSALSWLFAAGGVWILMSGKFFWTGLSGIVFFSLSGWAITYMTWVKATQKAPNQSDQDSSSEH